MRRILRKIASDLPDQMGDITTLSDTGVVDEILKKYEELKKSEANS